MSVSLQDQSPGSTSSLPEFQSGSLSFPSADISLLSFLDREGLILLFLFKSKGSLFLYCLNYAHSFLLLMTGRKEPELELEGWHSHCEHQDFHVSGYTSLNLNLSVAPLSQLEKACLVMPIILWEGPFHGPLQNPDRTLDGITHGCSFSGAYDCPYTGQRIHPHSPTRAFSCSPRPTASPPQASPL